MNQDMVLKLAKDALQVVLMISGPMLLVSLVVGVFISMLQVVTSVQDMTLSFVPRIISVFLMFLFAFPWMMSTMLSFTVKLIGHLERFAR